jgi:hypothetical protein
MTHACRTYGSGGRVGSDGLGTGLQRHGDATLSGVVKDATWTFEFPYKNIDEGCSGRDHIAATDPHGQRDWDCGDAHQGGDTNGFV